MRRTQRPRTLQCSHQPTWVEANKQGVGFRASFVWCTVPNMWSAFLFLFSCAVVEEAPATVGVNRVVESGGAIRNCLRVATGIHEQGDRAGASDQVLHCYNQHFAPIEPTLREHNRRATLSLEYGFGLVAKSMTGRRSEPKVAAAMLADRVESVLSTIPTEVQTEDENGTNAP